MKIYEVWVGEYEDSEPIFKHTSKTVAEVYLKKTKLTDPTARLWESEVSEIKEFNTLSVWLKFATYIDNFDLANKKGVDYSEILKYDWSPFILDCRKYDLEKSYFDTELKDIYELENKKIDFDNNVIIWKDGSGPGDFGVLIRFDFLDILKFERNHSDFRNEILSSFTVWFENWAEKMKTENKDFPADGVIEISDPDASCLSYCD